MENLIQQYDSLCLYIYPYLTNVKFEFSCSSPILLVF